MTGKAEERQDPTLPGEFSFIRRHFRALAGRDALDLTDDAAVLTPPAGRQLVIAADAMVEGVHFLPDDPPETIGRKLLRANLSDMAAMDAHPFGWLLTLACPAADGRHDEQWFEAFSAGLAEDQKLFGVTLLGGDTTSTRGPLVLSLTILGDVVPGGALRRNGARPGDGLWVTGTIGDGALGLQALLGRLPHGTAPLTSYLIDRYRLPVPRMGLRLAAVAHAGMDVSDGLVQDAGHLARESGLRVILDPDAVPLSPPARDLVERNPALLETCLTGGDDYELLLAVPDGAAQTLQARCAAQAVPVTRIGHFETGEATVHVRRADGGTLALSATGWSHF